MELMQFNWVFWAKIKNHKISNLNSDSQNENGQSNEQHSWPMKIHIWLEYFSAKLLSGIVFSRKTCFCICLKLKMSFLSLVYFLTSSRKVKTILSLLFNNRNSLHLRLWIFVPSNPPKISIPSCIEVAWSILVFLSKHR